MTASHVADHASEGRLDERPPAASLATALVGNGGLLVPLDRLGEPVSLHWPGPDRLLAGAALRLRIPGGPDEVDAGGQQAQTVEDDTDVVTTVRHVRADGAGVQLRLRALVHPTHDALVIELSAERPGSPGDAPTEVLVELVAPSEDDGPVRLAMAWSDAPAVAIDPGAAHRGTVTLAPEGGVTLVVAFARTTSRACALAARLSADGFDVLRGLRRAHDLVAASDRTGTLVTGPSERLDAVGGRVLRALTDRRTGAVIAAPECDPGRVRSGGYGFVWVRDLALIALAAAVAGDRALALGALRWLPGAQSSDGLFEQRHHADGRVAPGWGLQIDETGAALHAVAEVSRILDMPALVDELWPMVVAAADALVCLLDPSTGLPAASMDVWEERLGVHTATAAATAAGLSSAAHLAQDRDDAAAARWSAAADRVRAGIDRWLWSTEHGRFLRSRDVARSDADGEVVPDGYLPAGRRPGVTAVASRPLHEVRSIDAIDATVDASLLALTFPFDVIAHDDPRMRATVEAVARELTTAGGALLRYPGDRYLGGNPWVLTTLWLGLARRAPGEARVAEGLDLALAAASGAMLLPEQVDAETNRPVWVSPLAWSHAFALLASRPDHRPHPA
jgi:glycogen debranching enzyme